MMKMLNLPTYSITTTNITPHVALTGYSAFLLRTEFPCKGTDNFPRIPRPAIHGTGPP